jgi:heme exporter protein C
MFSFFANPARFMALSRWLAPVLGAVAAVCLLIGVVLGVSAPGDYQQHQTVKIMFVHVPAAWMGLFCYGCLAGASFFGLVFRHSLADAAAKSVAPLGAAFTALALVTGSLWGRPMWGTWWAWGDARLTSEFILFVVYLGYMALHLAIDDEQRAARAAAILAMVGVVNLPIVHFSVEWWNSLHQGQSVMAKGGPRMPAAYLTPLLLMTLGYTTLFGALWLVRIRAEVWRRRALTLTRAQAEA